MLAGHPVRSRAVVFATSEGALPVWVRAVLDAVAPDVRTLQTPDAVLTEVRRSQPALALIDAAAAGVDRAFTAIRALKQDAHTAVVPCVVVYRACDAAALLRAGADEVIDLDRCGTDEAGARVEAAVRRSRRDLASQPTTRLPGAGAIEVELARRIAARDPFAACYADLDHFKEFNDRYGYQEGDRVIRMLARVLHDAAVGAAGAEAFVGHIGGDDFMLVLPLASAAAACTLAIEVFDTFVPFQYSEADRRSGYYFGKDRRGDLHRVPLMTLSIGATSTERRRFRTAAEVSRLASEMKSFAKARPGSVYAVDRRGNDDEGGAAQAQPTRNP